MVSVWRVADVTISSSLGRQDCCSWLRWRWWRRCWKKCLDESAIRHVVNSSPLTVVEFVAWHNFTPYWFQLRRHLPIYNNLIVSHPAQLRPLFTTFTAHSFTALFCSIFISIGPRYGMQPSVCLSVRLFAWRMGHSSLSSCPVQNGNSWKLQCSIYRV